MLDAARGVRVGVPDRTEAEFGGVEVAAGVLITTPVLPAGAPVLLALTVLAAAGRRRRAVRR